MATAMKTTVVGPGVSAGGMPVRKSASRYLVVLRGISFSSRNVRLLVSVAFIAVACFGNQTLYNTLQ